MPATLMTQNSDTSASASAISSASHPNFELGKEIRYTNPLNPLGKLQPNKDVFKPVLSMELSNGATAYQDESGVWYNALRLPSSELHPTVAAEWQKQCIPLLDFRDAMATTDARTKRDIIIPESDFRFRPQAGTLVATKEALDFTEYGMSTVGKFAKVPESTHKYLRRKDAEARMNGAENPAYLEHLASYINTELDERELDWAQREHYNGARSFRLRLRKKLNPSTGQEKEVVRAVVSESYRVINNLDALDLIIKSMPHGRAKDALVSYAYDNGDYLSCTVIMPQDVLEYNGVEWGVGFTITNDETGRLMLVATPTLWKAICFNGSQRNTHNSVLDFRVKHLGNESFSQLLDQFTPIYRSGITLGHEGLREYQVMRDIKLSAKPENYIAMVSRDYDLSTDQAMTWQRGYYLEIEGGATNGVRERTADALVQGLTLGLQRYSGESRTRMEIVAGEIVAGKHALQAKSDTIVRHWEGVNERAKRLDVKAYVQDFPFLNN